MGKLAQECLDILNEGHFRIVEPGPLHAPIRGFSLRRDEKLALILETDADPGAVSVADNPPPGTVRFSIERARLTSIVGAEAELSGVIPYSVRSGHAGGAAKPLKELAQIRQATVSLRDQGAAAFTIDWLENLPLSPFIWPDASKTLSDTSIVHTIGGDEGLVIGKGDEATSFSNNTAKLVVGEVTFYLCALPRVDGALQSRPGCIIFVGTPDLALRKKIRTALSFALGLFLVDLGHTLYDKDWHVVSALARSAYTLNRRAMEMGPDQLAPLGPSYLNELDRARLSRAVNRFVAAYDDLDLANLGWAYWHACAATPHIAPAHFGAAIEALQRAYLKKRVGVLSDTWASRDAWKPLKAALAVAIEASDVNAPAKAAFVRGLSTLNSMDQRTRLKSVFSDLGLRLGDEEDAAWARRNKAAHGMPIPEGQELDAIRDTKLLKGVFHRMLLRITGAADQYVDYCSAHHPYRSLEEPPEHVGPTGFGE